MVIKEEGRSVYDKMIQKKKKVKSSGNQTVIKMEENHQSVTQAKAKVKKKKRLVEEDLDQLNSNKKKKTGSKLKERACSDNPVITGSSSNSESVKEIKEKSKILKKKSKTDQDLFLLTLENNQDKDQDLQKPHKTHSRENMVSSVKHRENVAQNSEGENVVSKKKKKKKERETSSLALMEDQDNDHEVSDKNLKNQNKTTLPENVPAAKKHRENVVQSSDTMKKKKKKKKKKDKHDSLSLAGIQDNSHGISDEGLSARDCRKNQDTSSQENICISKKQSENIVQSSESDREVIKRKKKKSKDISSLTWKDNQDQSHSVSNKHLPRKKEAKSQEKVLVGKKHKKNSEDDSEVTKKKKKKIQKEEKDVTEFINLVDEGEEVAESEKITSIKSNRNNKKRKTKPVEDLVVDSVDDGFHENNNVHCNKKGKKRNKQGSQNSLEEPRLKKKKKVTVKLERTEDEAMECEDDVTIVEERKGNCDETNIDKVRRQALQEEIDRESGKTKAFRNKVESQDTKFGQWSTATFESSDQKTKFLKLMGAFKKGSASTQNPPATTEKPNMALNRKGEETLKQTLQMEFEKAIDLKHHRGIGLGFQPTANKKVHIDKYASRSAKFDD